MEQLSSEWQRSRYQSLVAAKYIKLDKIEDARRLARTIRDKEFKEEVYQGIKNALGDLECDFDDEEEFYSVDGFDEDFGYHDEFDDEFDDDDKFDLDDEFDGEATNSRFVFEEEDIKEELSPSVIQKIVHELTYSKDILHFTSLINSLPKEQSFDILEDWVTLKGRINIEETIHNLTYITDERSRSYATKCVAVYLCKMNVCEKGISISKSISQINHRLFAWLEITELLYEKGKHNMASQLIQECIPFMLLDNDGGYGYDESYLYKTEFLRRYTSLLSRLNRVDELIILLKTDGLVLEKENIIHILLKDMTQDAVIPFIENMEKKQIPNKIKVLFYYSFLEMIYKLDSEIVSTLLKLVPNIYLNQNLLSEVLYCLIYYVRFESDKEMNYRSVLNELQEFLVLPDVFKDNVDAPLLYTYDNRNEWIPIITDPDDLSDINGWIRRVEKGKMSQEKFNEFILPIISFYQ
ncbi:hypothetical protein [Niallia endozanthoxylica]|uniref:Uncharacterized protein n=1 Tax=Niallia endozanthoxylica TaxID=2036016 RepID=A0A5J5HXQ5_9BACI|nr:hypothetical protein [Niallia endozanthoxylica]KAA9027764.1 hypothetical protein F4V44_05360 [Niallia endozanthoxylica]